MKSILIVVYAHYVKLIIEGKKTVEVRKNKNLANAIKKLIAEQGGCWIYIYVAKSAPELYVTDDGFVLTDFGLGEHYKYKCLLNGKVVARFWCDAVYTYDIENKDTWNDRLFEETTKKLMCLSLEELHKYVGDKVFYGIHISKLEVFDRPRELKEFNRKIVIQYCKPWGELVSYLEPLTKAPQNYCYVESEN